MRRSAFFCETLHQSPAEAEAPGHQLLLRGAFIQSLAAGLYSFLPLGQRVKAKIEAIMRDEMNAIDGQEIVMPVVHPAELWQETGRWYQIGAEMARFKDRGDRDMVLAMTHEEVFGDLLRKTVRSYRQLPIMLYQIQTKFRDEPRSRGGLIRTREFTMKDAYSCHASYEGLDLFYPRMVEAYLRVFRRCGVDVVVVESDVGMMGGTMAHEFMALTPVGEDQLVLCDACGYAANRQVATFRKDVPAPEEPAALREVETPGTQTIAALTRLLGITAARTAKAAFFMAEGSGGSRLIFAVVRGDMEVNETKLTNAVAAVELRPANAEELVAAGIAAGYASPVGISGATVVVDDLVARSPNLVAGANRVGYHLLNTNVPRDYTPDIVTDIAAAFSGAPCPRCGTPVRLERGVEVGNTFKLGTHYSTALGATFQDESGQRQDIVMGSYGIGVSRLIGTIAETRRDERGLLWPPAIAPFGVYLVGLDLEREEVRAATEALYVALVGAGVEVLYDDRDERAGVKFNDADLLGMPLRITVSRRTLANGAMELKPRGGDAHQAPLADALAAVQDALA